MINSLQVRVRDIAKTGEILDRSVSLGVNQGGGISFTNEDPAAARTDARKKAVADAIDKARTLTDVPASSSAGSSKSWNWATPSHRSR